MEARRKSSSDCCHRWMTRAQCHRTPLKDARCRVRCFRKRCFGALPPSPPGQLVPRPPDAPISRPPPQAAPAQSRAPPSVPSAQSGGGSPQRAPPHADKLYGEGATDRSGSQRFH